VFSERIRRRYRLFWKTRRLTLHTKGQCLLTYLTRDDPEERWHCCDLWQRKLSNKWNSREFVQRYGCPVPALYWSGRNPRQIPFASLPDRYVIRPVVGHSRQGVYVMVDGVDLISGQRLSRDEIVDHARRALPWYTRRRLLVEEFIMPVEDSDVRPLEIKVYTFSGQIGAYQYLKRLPQGFLTSWRDPEWKPLPLFHSITGGKELDDVVAPDCIGDIGRLASSLGRAYGTYVRIDFHVGRDGAVFNEFAATPMRGETFTAFGDAFLEECWAKACPDRI